MAATKKPTLKKTKPRVNAAGQTKRPLRVNVEATELFPHSINGKEPFDIGEQLSNLAALGARSPEEHYAKSQLTPSEIARMWGIDAKIVCMWRKNQRWDDLRSAYAAITPVEAGGQLVTIDLESERAKFQRKERENWEILTAKIMQEVGEDYYEVPSPTGGKETLRKNGGHRKQEASALREANDGARLSMGLATKTSEMFKNANINTGDQILRLNIISPTAPAALPAPAIEATEGEVIDSPTPP